MTVGELIDYLSTRPRDQLVVLAKDAERNGYSPLETIEDSYYLADSTWSGELVGNGDGFEGVVPAVVLGPVN